MIARSAAMSAARYRQLKIITIVEPDSLSRLVTDTDTGDRVWATERCDAVKANGAFVDGVRYALDKLRAVPNVYTYLDIAFHGRIGWPDDFRPVAELMARVVRGTAAGFASVDGIATNVADYSPVSEPFVSVTGETKMSKWIDWNDYTDEGSFAAAFRLKLISLGFPSGLGILIDTSRNGWGGEDRPTKAYVSANIDERIDRSRVDRRYHKSDWCNQRGAALGERVRGLLPGRTGVAFPGTLPSAARGVP